MNLARTDLERVENELKEVKTELKEVNGKLDMTFYGLISVSMVLLQLAGLEQLIPLIVIGVASYCLLRKL